MENNQEVKKFYMHDMHVHTLYSNDANGSIEAYINYAQAIGVKTICFAEHVDNNPNDWGLGYYDSAAFFADFNKSKAEIHDIELLAGIEFDSPHRYQKELSELSYLPYDCIIGSVHYCNLSPDLFFPVLVKNGITAEDCYSAYWKEIMKCVTLGNFDVLGHIDIPKRYYRSMIYDETALREIFHVMHSNGIILEINTSSLRKGLSDTMPGNVILEIYCSEGGKYVTIGSDAHSVPELAADNAATRKFIGNQGLQEVIFIERKMVVV